MAPFMKELLLFVSIFCGVHARNTFDAVFTACIQENSIPEAEGQSDLFLKTIHGLMQSETAFQTVTDCVVGKQQTLVNSDDAVEFYTGYLFNQTMAHSNLGGLSFGYHPDSECLQSWGPKVTAFLENVTDAIYAILPSISDQNIESILCSTTMQLFYTNLDTLIGMTNDPNCEEIEKALIANTMALFTGFCGFREPSIPGPDGVPYDGYPTGAPYPGISDYPTGLPDGGYPTGVSYAGYPTGASYPGISGYPTGEPYAGYPTGTLYPGISGSPTGAPYTGITDYPKGESSTPESDGISWIYPSDSVFFRCSNMDMKDFWFLFPPSESSHYLLMQVDNAQDRHTKAIGLFCSNVGEFSQCVTDALKNPGSEGDSAIAKFFNADGVANAFQHYCSHSDLISSQFSCTQNSLYFDYCEGGLMGAVKTIESNSMYLPHDDLCWGLYKAAECRVEKQLRTCNQAYGDIMYAFYKMLATQQCQAAVQESIATHKETPGMYTCVATHLASIETSLVAPNNFQAGITMALNAIKSMCKASDTINKCMKNVHLVTQNPYDKLLFQVFMPGNIEIMTDYFCSQIKVIEANAFCAVATLGSAVMSLSPSGDSCLLEAQVSFSQFQQELDNISSELEAFVLISNFCKRLEPLPACLDELVGSCGRDLSMTVKVLGKMIVDSCNRRELLPIPASGDKLRSSIVVLASGILALITI